MGAKLMDALRTFRVEGELVGRTTGPVVTQFEIEPAPGVKVRQIANLVERSRARDARAEHPHRRARSRGAARSASRCRIRSPEIVSFRELIETRDFQSARAALPIAFGKDLEGKPVIADLAKMPHLLIAGATGSGKSVCVNTIITSLVYRHTPQDAALPDGRSEDGRAVGVQHAPAPAAQGRHGQPRRGVGAQVGGAGDAGALRAARGERLRNIQDFNRRVQDGAPLKTAEATGRRVRGLGRTAATILPYIVVIIDEMADLMMTVQGEVETPIAMLAQKARAIGIHLILATQRPSVNVITGLIKANFPSRIAFRVASQVDSRTIIDGAGAESAARQRRHAVHPAGQVGAGAAAGRVHLERGHRAADGVVRRARSAAKRAAFAAQGLVLDEAATPSRTSSRRSATAKRPRRRSADGDERRRPAIATSCSARRPKSSSSISRGRRRCCSGDSRSATAAPRASSTSCMRPECSVLPTARSRATCSSGCRTSTAFAVRVPEHLCQGLSALT